VGHPFRTRLAALHLVVVALTLLAVGAAVMVVVRGALHDEAARRLEAEARLVAAALPAEPDRLRRFVRSLAGAVDERITLIAEDGTVLADSQLAPAILEEHGTRPEIVRAREAGVGVARRDSASTGRPLFYVAVRVDTPGPIRFVRLALPVERLEAPLDRVRGALLAGLLVGGGLGVGAALLVSRSLRARAAGLAAFAGTLARGGPGAAAGARHGPARGDEFSLLERHLEAAAADLSTYVTALDEQRRRVEAIVGSMAEGLIVVADTGEVVLMNAVAERLLGIRPGEWRGHRLLELTRHLDLHAVLARAGREGRAEAEVRFATPQELDLAVSVAPLRGPDAEPAAAALGQVVVLRDVTRLKRLERTRTDFVANVSHELKTPLAAIRAALETLHDWALEDPAGARRWVAMSLAHAERLQRLIDDLLALSDIELRQVRLDPKPVDLSGAVEETFGLLRAKAEARGVALVRAIPPGLPALTVDRNRLIQILVNLVDNGVKFTPPGGRVTVSAEPQADGAWAVVVADTGIGVPRADLPRLGERFYRVDKARSRDAGGTGLGLAIVKHLTQLQGGRLEIASEVGKGTTVRVILPESGTAERASVPAERLPLER
jgi:two-component system phosphate regulon sensor histidine kinase PhoR